MENTSSIGSQSFDKSLSTDIKDFHLPKNSWVHARNAINNSSTGDMGDLGNEPANIYCSEAPYEIIGTIYLHDDQWIIFSTNNTNSEIGIFTEGQCLYHKIANSDCLKFSIYHLITGISRKNFDCTWQIYWQDGLNPDRTMNVEKPAFKQIPHTINGCTTYTDGLDLDCDKLRLSPIFSQPCVSMQRGIASGSLLNGSYYVVVAYSVNEQKVTDYSTPSNFVTLFDHNNIAGSLDITIQGMETDSFTEFELVIVSTINQQTTAKRVGYYSTRQNRITIDIIADQWVTVPLEFIPIRNPIYEKSDKIYGVNSYMLRIGPTSKFDFNYQPLANQITANWVAVEYPAKYYINSGVNTGYMRDEVYPFFIRWIYDTGDKTSSYHIPGRAAMGNELGFAGAGYDVIEILDGSTTTKVWEVVNTATYYPSTGSTPDGGNIIARGKMAYWESSEKYPDGTPNIWGNLCGQQIRHHKFPEQATDANTHLTWHHNAGGDKIRIMGVEFTNIQYPLDNDGITPIPGIVGYEILRGSREGNKTVLAKGIINNMMEYTIPGNTTGRTGLYPNYPYNEVEGPDVFLSNTATTEAVNSGNDLISNYTKKVFTFHSPDTNVTNPYLSAKELKVYGSEHGNPEYKFTNPDGHPKHKLITDFAFILTALVGVGLAAASMQGKKTTRTISSKTFNLGLVEATGEAPILGGATAVLSKAATDAATDIDLTLTAAGIGLVSSIAGTVPSDPVVGTDGTLYTATGGAAIGAIPGMIGPGTEYDRTDSDFAGIPSPLRLINGTFMFSNYLFQGTDSAIEVMKLFIPWRNYALQNKSHCFYNNAVNPKASNHRRKIIDAAYLPDHNMDFGTGATGNGFRINNVFRSRTVVLELEEASQGGVDLENPDGQADNSKQYALLTNSGLDPKDPINKPYSLGHACSHYVGLKQRIRNQYGQLENIIQVPVSTCMLPGAVSGPIYSTTPLFNGDIYISRYTEKNNMFFFYNWLEDLPDGTEFDYTKYEMLPYPRFWVNTEKFDLETFFQGLSASFISLFDLNNPGAGINNPFPSGQHVLDGPTPITALGVKHRYFYLFVSGVRDFFVESEYNMNFRDWGEPDGERFYDPYKFTDLDRLLSTRIIKSGNYFKYDMSLGIARTFNNYISWGSTHPRYYDPYVAATCYLYKPNTIIYSLPQQDEAVRDNWRIFLANNYKDFVNHPICIKSINSSGALIFFTNDSPVQFLGVDTLKTESGTKLTIGDGGLFSQPQQSLTNTDRSYEYASCQDSRSVINTPMGTFWISSQAGKIFQLAGSPMEITMGDMMWWFAMYLPSRLLQQIPNFQLTDNPVSGIGCQSIYDNTNKIIYFCKKDYEVKPEYPIFDYLGNDDFIFDNMGRVKLGDPMYFNDCSVTISYDVKTKSWLSYHDWHPNLTMQSRDTFLTIPGNSLWIHNSACNSYCNYYGIDYPFEVEFQVHSGAKINTLRSIEYFMEVYKYDNNCHDRYHVLDFNFDEAVIFNSEQCSGLLKLNIKPKNNAPLMVSYPIINANSISILYSKEENKYRLNQFWDTTDDRGEYTNAQRMIWNTESNGYIKSLNSLNLNYSKDPTQRKKFRHYCINVFLRRRISGDKKVLLMVAEQKLLTSPR